MKKNYKTYFIHLFTILFFNFLISLVFLLILEMVAYDNIWKGEPKGTRKPFFQGLLSSYKDGSIEKRLTYNWFFRKVVYGDKDKTPVILFGCSYSYGNSLELEETFGYQLSKLTNRTVYNYSVSGGSPKETLYLLRYYKDLNKISNPEYVIYTYIGDHVSRITRFGWTDNYIEMPVFVKKPDQTLEYQNKKNYLHKLRTFMYLNMVYSDAIIYKNIDLLNIYFTEIQKEITKKYPKTKFVIFVYDDKGLEDWNTLEQKNIEVIHLKDLSSENFNDVKYRVADDDPHPNAKAWNLIVPALAKRLKL
ncbi:MAG: hypothetical protein K6C94_07535 [Candidatus Gastranaerophilales bacterium]|nr:hypothetical protein [Candidatus Gastranaerophilales bacterium]